MGMGSHHSTTSGKTEWLTPPHILKALGEFDLDLCTPIDRPWPTANKHYTVTDDGLSKDWSGRVFCNPPYGSGTSDWLAKCAQHRNATALIFARTETKMFFDQVWDKATAVLFIKNRLYFHHVDGSKANFNGGAPSVLIAYDGHNANMLKGSHLGKFVDL